MKTLEAKKRYAAVNEAKADFDDVYTSNTPHRYIAAMAENGYEIGERARPFCCEAVKLLREKIASHGPRNFLT